MDFHIEPMRSTDWDQVAAIYWEGIQTRIATFQNVLPTWAQWDQAHSETCRLIAAVGGTVLGWAAISPVSSRCVYAGVGSVSIYIAQQYRGKGVGRALLQALIQCSEQEGYWTLESGVIRINKASLALHSRCGFRVVGVRERIGKMDTGIWYDVVIMERRSQRVGLT
jgi:phosphinothricin acetyltransferase